MENSYKQMILKSNTLDELNDVKEKFMTECLKREKKIKVSNILNQVQNFGGAKSLFESIAPSLMSKKGGKGLINNYVKIIKENKSLRTIYSLCEGVNKNNDSDSKKVYIVEALSLSKPVNTNEYIKGVKDIMNIINESFNLLGDDYILENISFDTKSNSIGESLMYLSSTKKTLKNLNEYMKHIDNVSEIVSESKTDGLDINLPLDKIVNEIKENGNGLNVLQLFDTDNKEELFNEAKANCLKTITSYKEFSSDGDVVDRLSKMEKKLNEKKYTFETFTKDMLYMTELQEVLK